MNLQEYISIARERRSTDTHIEDLLVEMCLKGQISREDIPGENTEALRKNIQALLQSVPSMKYPEQFFALVLPLDDQGNTLGRRDFIVEVKQVEDTRFGQYEYHILAPENMKNTWEKINRYSPFVEVEGPARQITNEEWVALIEEAVNQGKIDKRYLKRARKYITPVNWDL